MGSDSAGGVFRFAVKFLRHRRDQANNRAHGAHGAHHLYWTWCQRPADADRTMARFVAEFFPLLQITAGPDEIDPAVIPMSLQNPDFVKVPQLRLAFHTDNGIQPASDDVKRVILSAASALSETEAPPGRSRLGDHGT